MSRRYIYERMTPAQLKAALAELRLSEPVFARLIGVRDERLAEMLVGERDIPQSTFLICALLKMPGALQLASAFTESVTEAKPPKAPAATAPGRTAARR